MHKKPRSPLFNLFLRPDREAVAQSYSLKISLYFRKWNFLALTLKRFQETETSKIIFTFQETETLKKLPIFQEMEPFSPSPENFLYFRKPPKNFLYFYISETSKKFFIFQETKLLIFREKYIQNPSIFRTRSIFRTLTYSEPEAYLELCQTSTVERFAKNSYRAHFLIFREMELSSFSALEK